MTGSEGATVSSTPAPTGELTDPSGAASHPAEGGRSEERFRALVEMAPDAMVIVDRAGVVEMVNARTEALFGYQRSELVGRDVDLLVPDRFRARHRDHRLAFVAHPKAREMGASLELWGVRRDGREFPVEVSLSPLGADPTFSVAATVRDLTERRRVEAAQAHALRREREAIARLQEVDRLRSDFLSTVSHELRTPLTAIRGFSDILTRDWDAIPDARKIDFMARIAVAGARLDDLISDLLNFARLEAGQIRFSVAPVDVTAMLADALERSQPILSHHPVVARVAPDLMVLADRTAMARVMDNLIGNAVKFSPAGTTITIGAERSDREVTLFVADEGIGIPSAELDHIFNRFYRAGGPADSHPGTGIGLAIVKELTEAQGGRVHVSSTLGEGSTFRIVLPAN